MSACIAIAVFLAHIRIVGRDLIPSVFSRMNQSRFAAAGVHIRKLADIGRAGSAAPGAAYFDSSFFGHANTVERAAAGGLAGPMCRSAAMYDRALLKYETPVRHALAGGPAGRIRPPFSALLRGIQ